MLIAVDICGVDYGGGEGAVAGVAGFVGGDGGRDGDCCLGGDEREERESERNEGMRTHCE